MASNKQNGTPWVKCAECGEILYNGELSRNLRTCPKCGHYFPLEPTERISMLVDRSSLIKNELDVDAALPNARFDAERCQQSIITGVARLAGNHLMVAALDLSFSDKATGLFVCASLINAVSQAIDRRLPLLLISTNNNGQQGQHRAFLPGQMLSTNAAISRLLGEKLLYVSILAYADSQGYFPGFAYVADIVIAESKAPVMPRSGNQNTKNGSAQAAQTAFKNGIVDMIVPRVELRHTLTNIFRFFR
jgi:acetyl-CoA carboxylase beta subunit